MPTAPGIVDVLRHLPPQQRRAALAELDRRVQARIRDLAPRQAAAVHRLHRLFGRPVAP